MEPRAKRAFSVTPSRSSSCASGWLTRATSSETKRFASGDVGERGGI